MAAFCLDIHARYRCRHAGACCENWSVPAESQVVEIVRSRGLRRSGVAGELFVASMEAGGTRKWTVARDDRGDCAFFDREAGGLCIIHRDAGPEALPAACRHFPRKILVDQRGTLISLSHFCPTAAALLLTGGAPSIVEAHPPLRIPAPVEGLDACNALPPLLRPDVLCDIAAYDTWERAALAVFARPDLSFGACLEVIASATESIRGWNPGDQSLCDRLVSAFESSTSACACRWSPARAIERVRALTMGHVGDDLAPIDAFDDRWNEDAASCTAWFDSGMKNYLAARLFANWIAYQGRGLRTIVEWLRTCAAVVGHQLLRRAPDSGAAPDAAAFIEAVRSADLLLLHVLDTASFARAVSVLEAS